MRRLADQELALPCRLLEPRRDVDGVAGGELLVFRPIADHHLAGVDPGSRHEPDAVLAGELDVETVERVPHLARRPHRPESVVLVHGGDPEHGPTASPMNFSTVPPCRSSVACIVSK